MRFGLQLEHNKISSLIIQWSFNQNQTGVYQATQVVFPLAFTTRPVVVTTNYFAEETLNNSNPIEIRQIVSLFRREVTNVRISGYCPTNIIAIGH